MSNPYLVGNYAPVRDETTATDLPVTGEIPSHLDGRYLRIGPNPVSAADPATYHWFLGDGMAHGVRLVDGAAKWYRSRYVRSGEVADALGEPRRPGPQHGGFDFAPNTNIVGQAGRTFAIVEGGSLPYELTEELETVGPCDFDGTLPGGYTAHPHRDPVTGELHAVSYFWGWGNRVRYTTVGTDAKVKRSIDIECTGAPMMHDFSLTERHVVLYDLPVTLDLDVVAAGDSGRYSAGAFPYRWNPDYPARVGAFSRDGDASDIRWYDVDAAYVFHPMNAYDDGDDDIVLDVVRHPKMFANEVRGPNEGPPTLDRWTIDTHAAKVLETRLDDHPQEFPRIDERLTGQRHRYGYSVGFSDESVEDRVLKHDVSAGTSISRSFGAGSQASEFVFVPAENGSAEDDGVLMGYVFDRATDRSDLVLLDAGTLEDVARVQLPVRVPQGFHGNWVPNAS
jgi:carotenoid cleavage dioxygenase